MALWLQCRPQSLGLEGTTRLVRLLRSHLRSHIKGLPETSNSLMPVSSQKSLDKRGFFVTSIVPNGLPATYISCKEGQELELKYKVTDPEYHIVRSRNGFVALFESSSDTEKSIEISADMDGATITKRDFGIEVKKRG